MKLLLTGKDGQVGFELQRALAPLGALVAVDRAQCDLANPDAIRTLIRGTRPSIIVNPAAYTAVDKAESESELAFAVNATATGIIGEEAKKIGALVMHYSTDYVFDGTKPTPYTEEDAPNPQSIYGESKLAGEQALALSGADHIIFRTSWVFGAHGGNFAKTILRLAAERDSLNVVADQHGAPTSAALIADVTAHVLCRLRTNATEGFPHGLYHLAADGFTSWHAYAQYVVEAAQATGKSLKLTPAEIKSITTAEYPLPAARPANSRLDTSKLRQTFGLHLPTWQECLNHVLQQLL